MYVFSSAVSQQSSFLSDGDGPAGRCSMAFGKCDQQTILVVPELDRIRQIVRPIAMMQEEQNRNKSQDKARANPTLVRFTVELPSQKL
jgi:hypothetical protein